MKGFKVNGSIPGNIDKAVLVFAQHTSSWDAFYGLGICVLTGLPIRFTINKKFMFFPLNILLNKLGAIPVNKFKIKRSGTTVVDFIVDLFKKKDKLYVVLEPEGTRAYAPKWRMGFHRIATAANVPIILTFVDYEKMQGGFGPVMYPTNDIDADVLNIKAFYQNIKGKYPENGIQ